jgi:hypothetical protein
METQFFRPVLKMKGYISQIFIQAQTAANNCTVDLAHLHIAYLPDFQADRPGDFYSQESSAFFYTITLFLTAYFLFPWTTSPIF